MSIVNIAAIAENLRPGLAAINGMYNSYPKEWSEIFQTYESDKAEEREVQTRFLGYAQIVQEGAPLPSDTMGNRWNTSYVHKYVGLTFQITRQAIVDNLYKQEFPRLSRSLLRSMSQSKEVLGAGILNNGFNPLFPIGDGQPVFSLNHPIDNGLQANKFSVPTDLNETSLTNAIIAMSQFKDEAGLIAYVKPMKLVVPPQLRMVAIKLLGSAFSPDSANNAINPIMQERMVPKGFAVNHFLTDPNAWFLMSDVEGAFKHYIREPMETDVYTDFNNKNLLASGLERYSFGCSDWRGAWGSGQA